MSRKSSNKASDKSANRDKNVAPEPIDIFKHISEISKVSRPPCSAKFVPLKGPGRAELDRASERRRMPKPRNMKLVEDYLGDRHEAEDTNAEVEPFDENAVLAGLRAMNGGVTFSNRAIERRWARRQNSTADNETCTSTCGSKNNRDVFARNVGMRAILRQQSENRMHPTDAKNTAVCSNSNGSRDGENVGANACKFPFVADSIDPDFLSRRICGTENKDDFIIAHVGKSTKVNSRQYFIDNYDDSAFEFTRKNK